MKVLDERIIRGRGSIRDTLFSAVLSASANAVAGERRVATDQRELGYGQRRKRDTEWMAKVAGWKWQARSASLLLSSKVTFSKRKALSSSVSRFWIPRDHGMRQQQLAKLSPLRSIPWNILETFPEPLQICRHTCHPGNILGRVPL